MKLAERIYITAHGKLGECTPQKTGLQLFALIRYTSHIHIVNCVTTQYVLAINPVRRT
jgi:hypothetical protein